MVLVRYPCATVVDYFVQPSPSSCKCGFACKRFSVIRACVTKILTSRLTKICAVNTLIICTIILNWLYWWRMYYIGRSKFEKKLLNCSNYLLIEMFHFNLGILMRNWDYDFFLQIQELISLNWGFILIIMDSNGKV